MSKPTDPAGNWVLPPNWRDIDVIPETPPAPFRYERAVGWGECDPAQIAFTGNFPKWCLEIIEAWNKACLGCNWYELNLDLGMGAPFVHLENDFKTTITARWPLMLTLTVTQLGRCSIGYHIEGHQNGRLCFTGDYVSSFVDAKAITSLEIPPRMRLAIERFMASQSVAAE